MPGETIQAKAAGPIHVCAFITPSNTHNNTWAEAEDGSLPPLGITSEAAHDVPTGFNVNTDLAAVSAGDQIRYYPPGSVCLLKCSGGWTAADVIVPVANGAGATFPGIFPIKWSGAIAIETVNDGEFGLVVFWPFIFVS